MADDEDALSDLRRAAEGCHACPLWERATQTVFGEGPGAARIMLIGEQPGDQEDQAGHPFVGPAGKVLDAALKEAGIERTAVFLTNAVKHFKWEPRGKRRIHDKPNRTEVVACRPWLDQEFALVEPDVVVTLGATAAQALLGSAFRLTRHRGEILDDTGVAPHLLATIHPAAILRMADRSEREHAHAEFVADLTTAARLVA